MGLVAGVLLVAGCQSQPADLTEQDRARLEQIIDGVASTLRAGNHATWTGHFSEDAVIYLPNAPAVRGRAVSGACGAQDLLGRLQQLPEFDNEAVIAPSASTERRMFECWQRHAGGAAGTSSPASAG